MSTQEIAERILKEHNCKFISMVTECRLIWENQIGKRRIDDIFVLNNMSKSAWDYYAVH